MWLWVIEFCVSEIFDGLYYVLFVFRGDCFSKGYILGVLKVIIVVERDFIFVMVSFLRIILYFVMMIGVYENYEVSYNNELLFWVFFSCLVNKR